MSHFTEAEARQVEEAQVPAGAASELAAVAQTYAGRIFRHLVQGVDSVHPLIFTLVHVENDALEMLALFLFGLYQLLSSLLFCDRRSCCH